MSTGPSERIPVPLAVSKAAAASAVASTDRSMSQHVIDIQSTLPTAATAQLAAAVSGKSKAIASSNASNTPMFGGSAGLPASAAPVAPAPVTTYGPLPSTRTITMTMVPDWNQEAIRSPLRPATLSVVLGPANTTPEQASWVFTINLYAMDQHRGSNKKSDEESIGKGSRALLWYDGKPFPKYHHAVEADQCKLPPNDELKTVSVVLRTFSEEKDPNALVYVRRRYGVTRSQGAGYLKVVQGHHYYLNITFAAGSTIAQKVGQYGWRPMVYLNPRGPGERREIDPTNPTKGLLIFANFVTNWAQGVELVRDDREQRLAAQAQFADQNDEDNAKAAAPPPRPVVAGGGAVRVFGTLVGNPGPVGHLDPSMCAAVPLPAQAGPRLVPSVVVFNIPLASASTLAQQAVHQQLVLESKGLGQAQTCAASVAAGSSAAAAGSSAIAAGQERTSPFQYALSPMTVNGPPLDTTLTQSNTGEITYPQLEWRINTTILALVLLPSLNSKNYEPDFPIEATIGRFYRPEESALAPAMMAIEGMARLVSLDVKQAAHSQTKHVLSFLNTTNQLLGWQHVQRYIDNPLQYAERAKLLMFGNKPAVGSFVTATLTGSMDELQVRALQILRKLCHRVDWILELQRTSNRSFDPELALKVIAADREWVTEADSFMKDAEHKVVEMLHANQERFQQFREMQRRGVAWPHSAQLRCEIEAAGFVYRPMMIKRDRCVCDDCGIEVNGWKPWHNPLSFHNYEKHKIQPPPQLFYAPNAAAICQMITEANRRRALCMSAPPVGLPTLSVTGALTGIKTEGKSTAAAAAATLPAPTREAPSSTVAAAAANNGGSSSRTAALMKI